MIRRIICLILTLGIVLCLCACGDSKVDPIEAIESVCKVATENNKELSKVMNEYISLGHSVGIPLYRGELICETKYDEDSGDFACLIDVPVMNKGEIYTNTYFGYIGHFEKKNPVIDSSYEVSNIYSFWNYNWKH